MGGRADNRLSTDEEILKREQILEKLELHETQLRDDRIALMKMPQFRRVMADVMERGRMFESVMTGNSQTYHQSGRQDFCREIWSTLAEADQNLAFELLKPVVK
jgi:hypothetical protein